MYYYRTVLTHVERSLYYCLFFHLSTAYPLFLTRRYAGPFPEVLCWWMKLLVNFVPNCLFFSFCVNIILRVSIKAKFKLEIKKSKLKICSTWIAVSYYHKKKQFCTGFQWQIFQYFHQHLHTLCIFYPGTNK